MTFSFVSPNITQSGTDTVTAATAAPTGTTKTTRGNFATFSTGTNNLTVNGTLTIDSTSAIFQNNSNQILTINAGGELIVNGQKTTAANGPLSQVGLNWLNNTYSTTTFVLASTNPASPAKLTVRDASIAFGSGYLIVPTNNHGIITTQGDRVWLLSANFDSGNGERGRLRIQQQRAINFQANKTYVGVWLNISVNQYSLKGYTPVDIDGPEIGYATGATVIDIEDYDATYVKGLAYPNVSFTLSANPHLKLKNNLRGTNEAWRSMLFGNTRYNVVEYVKGISAKAQDAVGASLSDGTLYFQPVGTNVPGIRSNVETSDITFDLSLQTATFVSGAASKDFVFAWQFSNANATNITTSRYFCTGQTPGAETHTIYSSRYGYDKQSVLVNLWGNGSANPIFTHVSLPTTNKVIANAAAITGVTFNFSTKVISVTGTLTIQQIYDAYQYQLNQTANLQTPDECTVSNGQTYYVGWSINNTGTINAGTNLRTIRAETVTNSGTITAVYTTTAGTSKILQINGVTNGSSLYVGNNATGITTLYQANTNQATYQVYFAPGTTPAQLVARELYRFQRFAQVLTLADGLNVINLADVEDVGITQTTLATVQAYTAIETASKFYDRTAAFRLTEQGIKLGQIATRSGTSIEIGTFNHVINQSAVSVYSITSGTITTKSTSYAGDSKYTTEVATPPATITANSTEVITIAIEDANGNSQLTINGGDGTFQLWKVTTSTPTADYATGTLLATVGNGIYRFIGVTGFDIIGVDINSNIRRRTSMAKGVYTQAFYVGDQIQLAQAPEITEINTKVDILQNAVDALGTPIQVGDVVDSNIIKVNDVFVDGTGTQSDPWGPV